jgi:hypothetical protein
MILAGEPDAVLACCPIISGIIQMTMHQNSASIVAKFDTIAQHCRPQPFLRLAMTAKDFISVAGLLSDLHDEFEFEKAAAPPFSGSIRRTPGAVRRI